MSLGLFFGRMSFFKLNDDKIVRLVDLGLRKFLSPSAFSCKDLIKTEITKFD